MVEAKEWLTLDKHALAYDIVKPQNNELTRRICEKLGWNPQGPEFVSQCLTCHAGVDHHVRPPSETILQFGIQCESCHGPASEWARIENHQQVSWRIKTPAEKKALGMNDLRSPSECAEVCYSCHIGDIDQNRFVTHAMYAAGHPPLPPVELQTFIDAMPAHWKTTREKLWPVVDGQPIPRRFELQDQYFAANFGKQFAAPAQQTSLAHSFSRTRSSMLGAQVAQRVIKEMLRDAASRENLWGDYALFDCNACHHELFMPSSRVSMPGRIPGRPFPHAWWLASTPELGRDAERTGISQAELTQVFNAKPFGDRLQALTFLNSPNAQTNSGNNVPYLISAEEVRNWLRALLTSREHQTHDYWTAKQTAWLASIAFQELIDRNQIASEPVKRLLHELASQLELNIAKPQPERAANALFRDIENNNQYDARRTREVFNQLRITVAPTSQANEQGSRSGDRHRRIPAG